MLILGIDPGTATTGYGFIEINGNKPLKAIKYGLIETNKNGTPQKRLEKIHIELVNIIKTYKPDILAIEKIFFATNRKTAIRVGQAQGVMLLSASMTNTPVFEYAPGSIKKIVTGNGRAKKLEIQRHVRKYLGNAIRKKKGKKTHFDNAADALAVAICHALTIKGGDE